MQSSDSSRENREMVGPRVLLTDTNRWATPARLAIGLAKTGCRVSAVCPTRGHPLTSTSVVQEVFPYSSIRPLESLRLAIEATHPQIVIPCDDRGVQHLHELYVHSRSLGASGKGLTDLIEYSLGSPESYPIVSGRCGLLEIAKEEGLRVPKTRLLRVSDDLKSWQAEHEFPCVLKGDGTFGGRGVRIAQTPEQAETFFSEIQQLFGGARAIKRAIVNRDPFWLRPWWNNIKPAVIVQSHIVGSPANCAFFSWKGEVEALISVEVVSSDGMLGPANVVRLVNNPEIMLAATRIARRLSLSGFFGLDFMMGADTGAAYLIEMNPRCTPLSHLQLGKGRNLVEALSAQLSGRPPRDLPQVTEKEVIAYFPQAWHSESKFLASSFQDIPDGEPDLVSALLHPWPERSILFRIVSKLDTSPNVIKETPSTKRDMKAV